MKKSLTIVLALFVVALFVISTAVAGEEKKADEGAKASGPVKVTKDADGKVTGVKVADQDVVLDDMGKDLAALMDGKRTMAKGTAAEKDIAVTSYTITDVVAKVEGTKIVTAAGPTFEVDKKSAEEVAKMEGKNVEVSGLVAMKDGAKVLTVHGALKPAPEKKAEPK